MRHFHVYYDLQRQKWSEMLRICLIVESDGVCTCRHCTRKHVITLYEHGIGVHNSLSSLKHLATLTSSQNSFSV
jgi:L-lysine 2,3-aminomutase